MRSALKAVEIQAQCLGAFRRAVYKCRLHFVAEIENRQLLLPRALI